MTVTLSLRQRSHESEYWDLYYTSSQKISAFEFTTSGGTCEHSNDEAAVTEKAFVVTCTSKFCMGMQDIRIMVTQYHLHILKNYL